MEPTIICPKCKQEIKLTESLAAPLVESTRREYEKRLAEKDAEVSKRESEIRDREDAVAKARMGLDEQVAGKVKAERAKIATEEAAKARLTLATDLDQKAKQISDLNEVLKARDAKLAEALKAEADLVRKQRELDDAKRAMDLNIERKVQAGLSSVREQARKETEESMNLRLSEKEQIIHSMKKQLEEAQRRAEQGSQQLQGEVLELELEALIRSKFPRDTIEAVPKGEFGGDIIHKVIGPTGQVCGTILWESKRTKNWSDGWLPKLREDQRAAKAEAALLISQTLPKGVESLDQVEGVWIAHPRVALPVAAMLRQILIEVNTARQVSDGQQTKTQIIYQYLTGPRFRQRVEGIVEAFTSMKTDLDVEKKAITKQWAKREEQIERVMQGTVGMYGDLQGIAGKTLQEIEGLSLKNLEGPVSRKKGSD